MWDYGSAEENLAHYNTTKPPAYQYSGLEVPTIFFSGGHDYLGKFYSNKSYVESFSNRVTKRGSNTGS